MAQDVMGGYFDQVSYPGHVSWYDKGCGKDSGEASGVLFGSFQKCRSPNIEPQELVWLLIQGHPRIGPAIYGNSRLFRF